MRTYKYPTSDAGKVVRNLIESNGATIFGVEFLKKDGSLRKMQARLGVTHCLKGGVSGTAQHEKYINAYDMQKQAYRSINVETVRKISMKNTVITFE